jgi:hypothetical protein
MKHPLFQKPERDTWWLASWLNCHVFRWHLYETIEHYTDVEFGLERWCVHCGKRDDYNWTPMRAD